MPVRSLIALTLCVAFTFTACKGTTLGHFDVDESLPETTIEGRGAIPILDPALPPMSLDVTSSQKFSQEEYDYLTSIQLESLALSITQESNNSDSDTLEDGNDDNFDFLTGIDIYIQAEISGEARRELIGSIAEGDAQLSGSVQSIRFSMNGTDILPFVEASDGYSVQIEASGDAPPDRVIFGGDVVYRVGIGFR